MPPTLQAITLRVVVWLEGKHLAPLLEGGSGSSDGNGGGDDLMKAFLEAEKHTAGKVIAMEKFSKLCCALYVCVCQLSAASAVCCIRCMLSLYTLVRACLLLLSTLKQRTQEPRLRRIQRYCWGLGCKEGQGRLRNCCPSG